MPNSFSVQYTFIFVSRFKIRLCYFFKFKLNFKRVTYCYSASTIVEIPCFPFIENELFVLTPVEGEVPTLCPSTVASGGPHSAKFRCPVGGGGIHKLDILQNCPNCSF